MSLSSALSIALSGLSATTTALGIVSNNISNASTPGYTEKSAVFGTVNTNGAPAGVSVTSYTRATDAAVTASYNAATSSSAFYSTQYSYLQQVQSILDSSSNNPTLSSDISTFQTDWQNLSSSPESAIQQQTVINDGNKLAKDIQSINTQVISLQNQVTTDIGTTVQTLNSQLVTIQNLNVAITNAIADNQPTGDLQDERDQAINTISAITNVTSIPRGNGQIAIYTPSGTALVDGTAQTFSFDGTNILNSAGQAVTSGITGGSLQAQLNFVDSSASAAASTDPGTGVISKITAQLQTLVNALAGGSSSFASAYNSAVTQSAAVGASQHNQALTYNFFTVNYNGSTPDLGSFYVNSNLLNSSASLPETGTDPIANSFSATSTYTTSGLSAKNVTYSQLATAILSSFQTAANSLQSSSTDASTQQTYYQTALTNQTGVNTDSELVMLTTLQNSYAAAAHVINTIQSLYTTLEDIGGTV